MYRIASATLLIVVGACAGPVLPSPSATAPAASSTPSEAPPSRPPPTPRASPAASVFREVTGIVNDDGITENEIVYDVTAGGPGFVAVGTLERFDACPKPAVIGRVWTSEDGKTWTRGDDETFVGVDLRLVVNKGGTIYALGFKGSEYCPPTPPDYGHNIWRSNDGITWTQLTQGVGSPYDSWHEATVVDDTIVLTGWQFAERRRDGRPGALTSSDGVTWSIAKEGPRTLSSVATSGTRMVAYGGEDYDYRPWYSTDSGRTWHAGATLETDLDLGVQIAAVNGRFVALGNGCCGMPLEQVGLAWTSADGAEWTSLGQPSLRQYPGSLATDVPAGIAAFTKGGETQLSSDGLAWVAGPGGPIIDEEGWIGASASNADAVVLLAHQSGIGESRLWVAPAAEFEVNRWHEPLAEAQMPEIGVPYDFVLGTHCGIRVAFAGGIYEPVGPLINVPLDNPTDRGTLTLLSEGSARYDSSNGGFVMLRRLHPPSPLQICY